MIKPFNHASLNSFNNSKQMGDRWVKIKRGHVLFIQIFKKNIAILLEVEKNNYLCAME
jgi:hypothetical protein